MANVGEYIVDQQEDEDIPRLKLRLMKMVVMPMIIKTRQMGKIKKWMPINQSITQLVRNTSYMIQMGECLASFPQGLMFQGIMLL